QRVGRTDVPKYLAVRARDGLPMLNPNDVDTGADDIIKRCPGIHKSALDLLQDVQRLPIRITHMDNLAVRVRGCRPGDGDPIADSHGPRIACDSFPFAAR